MMFPDILTVFRKEWNEYLHARATWRGTLFTFLVPVLIFGVLFPIQAGREWIESPIVALSFAWLPMLFVSAMTADSFAGERERHTLETLLSSRLPDFAILAGKLLSAASYGLLVTALIVISGVVGVNIIHGRGEFIFYPLKGFIIAMAACVLIAFLIAGIGVLTSLKASTVRQAQQTMSFGIIFIALLPTLFFSFIPSDMRDSLLSPLESANPVLIAGVVLTGILFLDIILLVAARKRFKRQRLL